jgi:hypothetical protein
MGRKSVKLVCSILDKLVSEAQYYTVTKWGIPRDVVLNHISAAFDVRELHLIEAAHAAAMYEVINNFWEVYDDALPIDKQQVVIDFQIDVAVLREKLTEENLGQPRNDWYTRTRTTEEWYADALHQFQT